MTGLVLALTVIIVAIFVIALRKKDPNQNEIQTQSLGSGEEKSRNGRPDHEGEISRGDIQNGQTTDTLSQSGYQRVHGSQTDSVSAKDSQPRGRPPGDGHQDTPVDQVQSDRGKSSPKLKSFDDLGKYWRSQEYSGTRNPTQTQSTPSKPAYRRANWNQKQNETGKLRPTIASGSTRSQPVKSSLPWEYDSRTDSGRAYCPVDPAKCVIGEPNIPNHRSKRFARTRVTFWR